MTAPNNKINVWRNYIMMSSNNDHLISSINRRKIFPIIIFPSWQLYCEHLPRTLLSFLQQQFPEPLSHHFMPNNDPKHCSRTAQTFFEEVGINWWCTPPESPDLNPIENHWHELKEHLWQEIKPRTKQELIATLDVRKCYWSP